MSEFDDKLNAILNDPGAMDQIMALAKSLSGPPAQSGEGCSTQEPALCLPGPGRDAALLEALRPYLRPERQKLVDRTLELMGMLRMFRGMGQSGQE